MHQGPQHLTYVVILRPGSKQLKFPQAFLGSNHAQTHITLVALGFVYGYNGSFSFCFYPTHVANFLGFV